MAKMVPEIVKRAGTLNRHLRVDEKFEETFRTFWKRLTFTGFVEKENESAKMLDEVDRWYESGKKSKNVRWSWQIMWKSGKTVKVLVSKSSHEAEYWVPVLWILLKKYLYEEKWTNDYSKCLLDIRSYSWKNVEWLFLVDLSRANHEVVWFIIIAIVRLL